MKVICYGDSNTYGYDPRSFFGDRYDWPWPELLARKTGWQVKNQGENGREIPNRPVIFPEDTDLLIIMLGTNDLLQLRAPDRIAENMELFIAGINLEKEKILLTAPPPMTPGQWVADQKLIRDAYTLGRHYQALARLCGIRFVRIECAQSMAFDGVHMTQEGHMLFAEQIYQFLLKGE